MPLGGSKYEYEHEYEYYFSLDCCVVCYGQPALEKGKDMINIK